MIQVNNLIKEREVYEIQEGEWDIKANENIETKTKEKNQNTQKRDNMHKYAKEMLQTRTEITF